MSVEEIKELIVGGYDMISKFHKIFNDSGICNTLTNITGDKYTFPFYEIDICRKNEVPKFTEMIYKNSTIHLIRKYKILTTDYGV